MSKILYLSAINSLFWILSQCVKILFAFFIYILFLEKFDLFLCIDFIDKTVKKKLTP